MLADNKRKSLSRRGVVRASGGPLREVKVELGVVVLMAAATYLVTWGVELAPWQEVVAVLVAASVGAGWIVMRTRAAASRAMAAREGRHHGSL